MERWYAVHDQDGNLVSTGTSVADDLPDGLTVVSLAKAPDESVEWDPATRKLKARTTDPAAVRDKAMTDRLDADPDYQAMSAAEKRQVRVLARLLRNP